MISTRELFICRNVLAISSATVNWHLASMDLCQFTSAEDRAHYIIVLVSLATLTHPTSKQTGSYHNMQEKAFYTMICILRIKLHILYWKPTELQKVFKISQTVLVVPMGSLP